MRDALHHGKRQNFRTARDHNHAPFVGYVILQSIYGPLDKGMRQIGYYFAAGSFHTKKLLADFFWQNLNFTDKNRKIAFCATLCET